MKSYKITFERKITEQMVVYVKGKDVIEAIANSPEMLIDNDGSGWEIFDEPGPVTIFKVEKDLRK